MKKKLLSLLYVCAMLLTTTSLHAVNFSIKSYPRLLVNQEAIDHARENMQKYDWAAANAESLLQKADNYEVPKPKEHTTYKPGNISWKSMGYVPKKVEELFEVGLAWTLFGKEEYLDKIRIFIDDVCDEQSGYIAVGAATTGDEVHEGMFFFYFAALCDILYSQNDILTVEQKDAVDKVMLFYLEKSKDKMAPNGIMNHQASTNAAAVLVSMFMQDEEFFTHFTEAEGGMIDHMATGIMPDGWWFESTVNYSQLVADIYFKMAQVYQNSGMDLYRAKIPAREMDKDFHNAKDDYTGMKFAVWGPQKPYRTLHDMATAYYPLMDENGVTVASNDTNAQGPSVFYELAYKEYGDSELAWVLSKMERDSWISLFYGVGEIPEVKDPRTKSATQPNVGLTALRAQNREGEEQLQAYVKYGTHGGWHGQLDRVSLQALDIFGHKFFGTEMCWFGYQSAQYKELVQTSASHNMVIVDELQQEAVPSSQPIFYKGKSMQLSLTETVARWRQIPRNNREIFPPWDDFGYSTEPILQRRLAMVTDDYLLMVDYLSADKPHQFDCLLHPVGFQGVEGAEKAGELLPAITTNENSPYKYFPSCQWYKANEESVKFQFNDSGIGLDYHIAWPTESDIFYAEYPSTKSAVQGGLRNNPDRRTVGVRVNAKEAVFITLLEPYKGESVIAKVESTSDDKIRIYMKDGSMQIIQISNLKGEAKDVKVEFNRISNRGKVKTEKN
ncbi:MAG: hypothetical protein SNG38_05405 [Rikenellaceae bacterium]